jgi:hypothetical protein
MDDLTNLMAAYYDGYPNFFSVEEDEDWVGEPIIKIIFSDRDRFNEFTDFIVYGRLSSWNEDDHNIFNLNPFLIDIGYSDMIIILKGDIKNPNG